MVRLKALNPKMKELVKLLNLIGEALQYIRPEENRIVLDEEKILGIGLDKQDIKNCLKYLSDQDVARSEVMYAPTETKSNVGIIYASHTSTRTAEYNRVDYILSINREKLKPLLSQAAQLQVADVESNAPRLVSKDGRGDYYYDGKRMEMTKETIYYNIFDIVYTFGNQEGFIAYDEIEKRLVEDRGFPTSGDAPARNKRINNALKNKQEGLFRFAKVNGKRFKNETLDGQSLISLRRGEGVILNNPRL